MNIIKFVEPLTIIVLSFEVVYCSKFIRVDPKCDHCLFWSCTLFQRCQSWMCTTSGLLHEMLIPCKCAYYDLKLQSKSPTCLLARLLKHNMIWARRILPLVIRASTVRTVKMAVMVSYTGQEKHAAFSGTISGQCVLVSSALVKYFLYIYFQTHQNQVQCFSPRFSVSSSVVEVHLLQPASRISLNAVYVLVDL